MKDEIMITKKEKEIREKIRWSFLDIKNKRIKKLAKELINQLNWYNEKTKEESAFGTLIGECIESIRLKKINLYKKELGEEIKDLDEQIKHQELWLKNCKEKKLKKQIIRGIKEFKDTKRGVKSEFKHLNKNKEDIKFIHGYCNQICFPPKNSGAYPQWRIVLLEENIKNLSNKKIKLLIGHELAHAYINLTAKYGHQSCYEVDDLGLCDFIAKEFFEIK